MSAPYSYRDDPAVPGFPDDRMVLVFDGHCGVCSGWARTVMRRDRAGLIRLLPAQSRLGEALYRHFGHDPELTYMVLDEGLAFTRAEATFRLTRKLGAPYAWLALFRPLPRSWLDAAYDLVARNRFRIAGRTEHCMLPTPAQAQRFLG